MVNITFESHSTSLDNENHLSSGWNDIELSPLGITQAKELGTRRAEEHFDAIFCSDLQRSYKTAEIAFENKFPIIKDPRLRECNYGDLTQHPSTEIESEKVKRIKIPFPSGESYEQTTQRMKDFLRDLVKNYAGKKVLVIGHAATRYGLIHLIKKEPLEKIVTAPWQWQPGWEYQLEKVD